MQKLFILATAVVVVAAEENPRDVTPTTAGKPGKDITPPASPEIEEIDTATMKTENNPLKRKHAQDFYDEEFGDLFGGDLGGLFGDFAAGGIGKEGGDFYRGLAPGLFGGYGFHDEEIDGADSAEPPSKRGRHHGWFDDADDFGMDLKQMFKELDAKRPLLRGSDSGDSTFHSYSSQSTSETKRDANGNLVTENTHNEETNDNGDVKTKEIKGKEEIAKKLIKPADKEDKQPAQYDTIVKKAQQATQKHNGELEKAQEEAFEELNGKKVGRYESTTGRDGVKNINVDGTFANNQKFLAAAPASAAAAAA